MDKRIRKISIGTLLFIIFFEILAFNSIFIASSNQIELTGFAKPSELLAPGETEVPITFTIINLGQTLYNVNISPVNTYPLSIYSYYNSTDIINIPELATGSEVNVTFIYNVLPSAKDGVYKIPLQINSSEGSEKEYFTVPVLGYVKISGEAVWGSESSPLVVSPGEDNVPLTLILINDGNVMANNVSITFANKYPLKFEQNSTFVGYLPVGEPVEVPVYASIDSNATPGVYNVLIRVHYFNNSLQNVTIPVSINGYENFSISAIWGSTSEPITASPGSIQLPLTFIVKNLGDVTVTNVSLTIVKEYPISTSQNNIYIGIIPAGEENLGSITANVYPNATPGVYYIPVIIHYFDTKSLEYVPIVISSPKISINMITLPPQVFPGFYNVRIEAILTNYGTGIAQDANISLQSPFQIVSPDNFSIGAIPVGKPINVTFLINVPNSTTPGNYTLKFTVNYDGGKIIKDEKLTIYPKANIIIERVIYHNITPGSSKVPITFTLENDGSATAKNIVVYLGSSNVIQPYVSTSNPLAALTASEQEIGDLKPGQSINVTYIVDISGGASHGTYPVTLIMVWNQTGSLIPFEESQVANITLSQSIFTQFTKDLTTNPLILLLVIIIIVLIIVVAVVAARSRGKK
ncbi:hypothetical protein DFR86_02865 [Acidianus sulfidivorans JP7]|uniref:COG1361 S-layer family protein n=1 Tax=Acidianus sulfidivorans TaxID=312539 RepID=UPI001442F2A3|nr:hypothetical protein [Acidianus sulfidivorans]AWR96594.2 hypothetical protein DFR86_02865 [Acidianus sulfidivorans JP7]